MKLVEALEQAARDRGWSTLVSFEPSGNVDTLSEVYETFRHAPIYRGIEVGEWQDGEIRFEAPDLTHPDEPIRPARIRLISEAGKRLITLGMLGMGVERRGP